MYAPTAPDNATRSAAARMSRPRIELRQRKNADLRRRTVERLVSVPEPLLLEPLVTGGDYVAWSLSRAIEAPARTKPRPRYARL